MLSLSSKRIVTEHYPSTIENGDEFTSHFDRSNVLMPAGQKTVVTINPILI